jgi:hypothetical protein
MMYRNRRAMVQYQALKRVKYLGLLVWREFRTGLRLFGVGLIVGMISLSSAFGEEKTAADVAADLKKLISIEKNVESVTVKPEMAVKKDVASKKLGLLSSGEKKEKKIILPDAEEADDKVPGIIKYFTGTVAAKNNYGMAVTYEADRVTGVENEIWTEFKKSTLLKGYKKFSEILEGDKVQLTIKEVKTKEGIEKRILKQVDFIQHMPKEADQASSEMVKV